RVRFSLGDVLAQGGRGAEVDVGDVGAGQVGLDVGEDAHDARHGALDVEFLGADEGHVDDAQLAGGCRGEVAVQVGGGREPDADEVVRGQTVALQEGGQQRADLLLHVSGFVPFQLDGAPDRSYRHDGAPC